MLWHVKQTFYFCEQNDIYVFQLELLLQIHRFFYHFAKLSPLGIGIARRTVLGMSGWTNDVPQFGCPQNMASSRGAQVVNTHTASIDAKD